MSGTFVLLNTFFLYYSWRGSAVYMSLCSWFHVLNLDLFLAA